MVILLVGSTKSDLAWTLIWPEVFRDGYSHIGGAIGKKLQFTVSYFIFLGEVCSLQISNVNSEVYLGK